MAAFGLPELVVVTVIALLFVSAQRLSMLGRAVGEGLLVNGSAPAADLRYSVGVPTGTLAELFGLTRDGIRWSRALILVVGTWLSANLSTITEPGITLTGLDVALMMASPVSFVLCAITAVRSFQSGALVAVSTGILHAALFTSIRYILDADAGETTYDTLARQAVVSFLWPTLAMFALVIAVSGRYRWVRLVLGFSLAAFVEYFAVRAIYLGEFLARFPSGSEVSDMITTSLIWTAAFWLAHTRRDSI